MLYDHFISILKVISEKICRRWVFHNHISFVSALRSWSAPLQHSQVDHQRVHSGSPFLRGWFDVPPICSRNLTKQVLYAKVELEHVRSAVSFFLVQIVNKMWFQPQARLKHITILFKTCLANFLQRWLPNAAMAAAWQQLRLLRHRDLLLGSLLRAFERDQLECRVLQSKAPDERLINGKILGDPRDQGAHWCQQYSHQTGFT